ncbi:Helix-turn-helix domain protein [Gimesia maris]|uniref:helix-turn-helix domain-containing protein n=1 Tax=Gimesia maris TaxID=122 RepID=UPI00118AAFDF|nr:helix-turn-helix domain-containing protein [Gimesia maris]QDU15494.1 Helix-turn-helix domain protein [Gimesia maris]
MGKTEKEWTAADAKYGYRFSCDGVMDVKEAGDMLGVCERTVWNYIEQGRFRHGNHPGGKKIICIRSIRDYLASLES